MLLLNNKKIFDSSTNMNWYKIIKKAQIWKSKFPKELIDQLKGIPGFEETQMIEIEEQNVTIDTVKLNLYKIYELSYKYQYIQNNIKEFDIFPETKNNILNNIEKQIRNIIENLKKQINPIIENWLNFHARGGEEHGEEMAKIFFKNFMDEKLIFALESVLTEQEAFEYVLYNIEKSKILKNKMNEIFIQIIEDYLQNKNDEELEELVEIFEEEEEILFNIIKDYNIMNENELKSEVQKYIMKSDDLKQIIKEIYEIIYVIWKDSIEHLLQEPIKNITKAKEILENIQKQPIDKMITDINIVLNTMHTSGSIMEYFMIDEISNVNENFLTFLSNLDQYGMTDKWEKEIEEKITNKKRI